MPDKSSDLRFPTAGVLIVCALTLVLLGLAFLITRFWEGTDALVARTEAGWIEKSTIVFYVIVAGLCCVAAVRMPWQRGFYVVVLLALFVLREMDFDEFAAADGKQKITSTRYWRSGDFPIFQKLLVLLVLIAGAVALWRFCRGGVGWMRRALAEGHSYAASILGIGCYFMISLILDNRVDWNQLDKPIVLFFSLTEELIEMGIPILIGIAIIQWILGSRPGESRSALDQGGA